MLETRAADDEGESRGKQKVAILYHHFPHYRAPVLRTLAKEGRYHYTFWASYSDFHGIKAFTGDDVVQLVPIRAVQTGRGYSLSGYGAMLKDRSIDALVVIGNPNIRDTWVIAALGRLWGKKVLFWTHGWLRQESTLRSTIRNLYYRLAHVVLVYGDRAKELGRSSGYPANRIKVIYNSLDYDGSSAALSRMHDAPAGAGGRKLFDDPHRPLVICTARLTELCALDLLISAASILRERKSEINVLLVGDGPAREPLEVLARKVGVSVHFYGSCYNEEEVGGLIYQADLAVSPGKIGLTAIHSLSFGTPAITHDDLDRQMPEVEAIEKGVTGDFFKYGSAEDLAIVIERWISSPRDRNVVREKCVAAVAKNWNPKRQRELIEEALDACFAGIEGHGC